MKQLIFDYFRRLWAVYVLVGIIHIIYCYFIVQTLHPLDYLYPFAMFAGPFALYFDLQRGNARAVLALPLTVKQIARAWWLVSVGLPVIGLIFLGFLSAGASYLCHGSSDFHLYSLIIICVLNTLWLGATFFVLTGLPTSNTGTWWANVRGVFFGALWGLSLGGSFLFFQLARHSGRNSFFLIVLALCGLMSIAGWFSAEQLVLQRAGFRLASQRSRKRTAQYKISNGFNGIPLLFKTALIRALRFWLFMIVLMTLVSVFQGDMKSLANFGHFSGFMIRGGVIPISFIIILQMFPILMHLRFFRTLPFSTTKLAILLVFLPVVSILALGIASIALISSTAGVSQSITLAGIFLMLAAVSAMCVPLVTWMGCNRQTYFLLFFAIIGGTVTIQIFGGKLYLSLCALLCALAVIASCFFTKLALTHSRNAYRVWPNPCGGGLWNWGGNWGR